MPLFFRGRIFHGMQSDPLEARVRLLGRWIAFNRWSEDVPKQIPQAQRSGAWVDLVGPVGVALGAFGEEKG